MIYTGKIGSLRRFKEDVTEVKKDFECGLAIANFNDVKVGDIIEAFKIEKSAPRELVIYLPANGHIVIVGICTFELFIPHAHSLKEKRKVVKSLIDRVRSRHNVSIAEVEHHDLWQRAGIGITAVGTSRRHMEAMFEGILRDIDEGVPAEIVARDIQFA